MAKYQNLWRSYVFVCASSHRIRDINIWNIYIEKVDQMYCSTNFAMAPLDGKQNLYLQKPCYISCVLSHRFRDINIWNIWPLKSRSRSLNTTFAMALIDDKNQQVMLHMFVLSLTIFKILTWNSLVYLEQVGRVHEILLLQWRHSMENITRKPSIEADIRRIQYDITLEMKYKLLRYSHSLARPPFCPPSWNL